MVVLSLMGISTSLCLRGQWVQQKVANLFHLLLLLKYFKVLITWHFSLKYGLRISKKSGLFPILTTRSNNINSNSSVISKGLPRWLSGKESSCQSRRCGLDPWVGKIPWRRAWQPTPVFLPRESHGQRIIAWRAAVHVVAKSWTRLSDWSDI